MLTLRDVLISAANGFADQNLYGSFREVVDACTIWEDLLDEPLEDLQLSQVPKQPPDD